MVREVERDKWTAREGLSRDRNGRVHCTNWVFHSEREMRASSQPSMSTSVPCTTEYCVKVKCYQVLTKLS